MPNFLNYINSNTKYYIENSNKRYNLVKVDSVSDLRVRFHSKHE